MFKNLTIVGTILFFGAAILFLVFREKTTPKDRLKKDEEAGVASRMRLEEFSLTQHRGGRMTSMVSGGTAVYFESNVAEVTGGLRAKFVAENGQIDELRAGSAKVMFPVTTTITGTDAPEPESIFFGNQVSFVAPDGLSLNTEEAEYQVKSGDLSSKKLVTVDMPGRRMTSDSGFKLNRKSEVLELTGKVRGTMTAEDLRNVTEKGF